jgi:IS30 family transposase
MPEQEVLPMTCPTRIYYTAADKALMWDRWQQGESLHEIARHFGRSHASIRGILARTGGIRPRQRCRSRLALTLAEREEISRGVAAGQSIRAMAAALDRARRPKPAKLAVNRALAGIVAGKLRQWWSPEKTVPCRATGRGICCWVAATARSPPWWSATRAT